MLVNLAAAVPEHTSCLGGAFIPSWLAILLAVFAVAVAMVTLRKTVEVLTEARAEVAMVRADFAAQHVNRIIGACDATRKVLRHVSGTMSKDHNERIENRDKVAGEADSVTSTIAKRFQVLKQEKILCKMLESLLERITDYHNEKRKKEEVQEQIKKVKDALKNLERYSDRLEGYLKATTEPENTA
jgi:Zn-dependent oligopeptidase